MRSKLLLLLAGLAALLRAEAPLSGGHAAPAPAGASTSAAPLGREELVAALARDLAIRFNLDGEVQVELLRPWVPSPRLAATWSVTIVEFPPVPSSSMLVRCRVSADQTVVAETTLVLRVSHWRDAWVTVQPLAAGTVFNPAQLEPRRVDLFRERDAVPAAVGDTSFIFARALPAGRLLTWRDIARRPLVKKGSVVEVSAVEGLLLVTLKALAMENGARGDTVTVRNPESQKNFAAVVIDENRVQVRF